MSNIDDARPVTIVNSAVHVRAPIWLTDPETLPAYAPLQSCSSPRSIGQYKTTRPSSRLSTPSPPRPATTSSWTASSPR